MLRGLQLRGPSGVTADAGRYRVLATREHSSGLTLLARHSQQRRSDSKMTRGGGSRPGSTARHQFRTFLNRAATSGSTQ